VSNYTGNAISGFAQIIGQRAENCAKDAAPEPDRDIDACLAILRDEVAELDSSLADLFGRLHPLVTDKISVCENATGFCGSTVLGSNLATLANRVASMRRAVNSYIDNLGV
jgi:hypothetical protein